MKRKMAQRLYSQGYQWDSFSAMIEIVMKEKQDILDEYEECVMLKKKDELYEEVQKLYRKYSSLPEKEQERKIKQNLFRKGYPRDWIEEAYKN